MLYAREVRTGRELLALRRNPWNNGLAARTQQLSNMSEIQAVVKALDKENNLEVQVTIPERAVTEDEALEAMHRQGKIEVPEKYLKDMETIGIFARRATVNIQRGKAMMTQLQLERGMSRLTEILATWPMKTSSKDKTPGKLSASQMTDFARALGFLAGKYTESQHFVLEAETVLRPATKPTDPDQINSAFKPGAQVRPGTQIVAQQVHVHNGQPPALPAKDKT